MSPPPSRSINTIDFTAGERKKLPLGIHHGRLPALLLEGIRVADGDRDEFEYQTAPATCLAKAWISASVSWADIALCRSARRNTARS